MLLADSGMAGDAGVDAKLHAGAGMLVASVPEMVWPVRATADEVREAVAVGSLAVNDTEEVETVRTPSVALICIGP